MEHCMNEYCKSIQFYIKSVQLIEFPFQQVACKWLITDLSHQKEELMQKPPQ